MTMVAEDRRGGGTAGTTERAPRPAVVDLGLVLRSVARSVPVALAVGLVVGVAVAVWLSTLPPSYTATTTVSVATASRAEQDASTMNALAAGMSEFVGDSRARELVEQRTGEPVVLGGRRPTVQVSTSSIPGFLDVVTRSQTGPTAAVDMGTAVVEAMNRRADELREMSLAPVAAVAEEEVSDLNQQITARRRIDPDADTSDLMRQIYEAKGRTESLRAAYPSARIVAQDDGGGEPTWPKPLATGTVAGLSAALLVAIGLGLLRLRRGRVVDRLWARSVGHRHGARVDVDRAPLGGLPPLTEAAVSAVLSRGGTVVVLGGAGLADPSPGDGAPGGRLLAADLEEPWWRRLPASEVDLGVVVADYGAPTAGAAEAGLATFAEAGVPARVAVREQGTDE